MEIRREVLFMISYIMLLLFRAGYPLTLDQCEEDDLSVVLSMNCPTDYTIVVTIAICMRVTGCDNFDPALAESCDGEKAAPYGLYCETRNPCVIRCTGSSDCSGSQSYAHVEYNCQWAGAGNPPAQETTPALVPTTIPADVQVYDHCQRWYINDRIGCATGGDITILWGYCTYIDDCGDDYYFAECQTDLTSEYANSCDGEEDCRVGCGNGWGRPSGCSYGNNHRWIDVGYHCTGGEPMVEETTTSSTAVTTLAPTTTVPTEISTTEATTPSDEMTTTQSTTSSPPPTTIPDTTTPQPTTQLTMTSQPSTQSQLSTQHIMTSMTMLVTSGTQTTENITTPAQKPLAEILTACFDNATEGESSAKPYRPLSFSTAGETETSRLSVSFYSPFLQTKPVKVAIEAFQEPKADCDTSPSAPSNTSSTTTPSSGDDKASGSALSLTSVVNVTVYCYNGAPLQLREGEYVDVVFPAKIDFDNEVPVCTSMKQDEFGWEWTTEGCKASYSNYTHVTCRCDHLSAIALQRGPKGFKVDGVNAFVLLILEKTLGFISVISVFVMLVIYATLGVKGSQLTKIQLNMAVSCLAGHATFLFGMKATGNLFICAIVAAVMQYFYTVYAMWLVVQTAVLFSTCYAHGKPRESNLIPLKVPEKSITEPIRLTRVFLLVWGGSLLLVGLLYKEIPYGFGTPESCWLVETENVYIIFISLITLALVTNFALAICTVVYLVKMDDICTEDIDGYAEWTEKLRNRVSLCLSSSLILSFVLVMAWSSHALLVFKSLIAFHYLFIVFNMIQGTLVFIFYCPLNPEVRAAIFRTRSPDEDEKKNDEKE